MKLRICSHLLKKSLMENFIFCAMWPVSKYLLKVNIKDSSKIQGSFVVTFLLTVNMFTDWVESVKQKTR